MTPITKSALKDPVGWLTRTFEEHYELTKSEYNSIISSNQPQLDSYSTKLHDLYQKRNIINREIGLAKRAGKDPNPYKHKATAHSIKIKLAEKEILEILASILESVAVQEHSATPDTNVSCPSYFHSDHSEFTSNIESIYIYEVKTEADITSYSNYINSHPKKTAYHNYGFKDLIDQTTGQNSVYLVAECSPGKVCGVLPCTILSTRAFGTYMVSLPWFNYAGPLADSSTVGEFLLKKATELAISMGCERAEFRESIQRTNWIENTNKISMTLPLPNSKSNFEKTLKSSLRAQSNKARVAGCTVHIGKTELINDFYKVFSTKMRDLGTPIHRKFFFTQIVKMLDNDATILVIRLSGKPVATGFLIAHGNTVEIPWASSIRRFDSLGVNMLLYREALGYASDNGFAFFDFGRSTIESSTYKFKKQWGAKPQQLYWHSWESTNETVNNLSQENHKFKLAIAVWRNMPVWLTVILGPLLIKGLP